MSAPIQALRASHDRLVRLAAALAPGQETGPGYPAEWSIAQVFSHLGSGAEILTLAFDAGRHGTPAPGREANPPIWDRWNAKAPADQVADALVADTGVIERFEALTPAQLAELRFVSFLGEVDADSFARLRLNEHALHVWDIDVVLDPTAVVGPESVPFVVDALGFVARFSGKSIDRDAVVNIVTTNPDRSFVLTLADKVALEAGADPAATAQVTLPAEAFVRLVYGRLDPAHTPPLTISGIELDELRRVFPGF